MAQPHMSPEEFRARGHEVIDWIAEYWTHIAEYPVLSRVVPGEIRDQLPTEAPPGPESFDNILTDLDSVIMPGITHWQHPAFFAYFPANSSPAAVLADLLSSGIGAQGMIWSTSPAATELEQVVLDWFSTALGLPVAFKNTGSGGGVIQDTASTSTMTAILAALHRASAGSVRESGVNADQYALYASTQAHSSVLKAAMMTGLGAGAVREIAVDPATQAMNPEALREALLIDREAGVIPVLVVSAVGTTSTCAIDPTAQIGALCREFGAWLHVDAAFAGVAAICPEFRYINDGVAEFADSYVTNPHKWMLTTFDCSTFWVRDRSALVGALSVLPEYLRNTASESGQVVDYRDWHPQLGRRFRSLKLWTVLRTYGISGIAQHIRSGVAMAVQFEEFVRSDPRFELLAPRSLSVVVFGLVDSDRTMELMEKVNGTGKAYLTHTKVEGKPAIRMAIGGVWTEPEHVRATWELLRQLA